MGWNQRISVWLSLLPNITQIITSMYCLPHLFYKILTLIRYSQNTRIFIQNMFMWKLWYRHNISNGSSRIWLLMTPPGITHGLICPCAAYSLAPQFHDFSFYKYSPLSNERDVTLTDFGKFHPARLLISLQNFQYSYRT